MNMITIIMTIIAIIVGGASGYFIHKLGMETKHKETMESADKIIEEAKKQADNDRESALLSAKNEVMKQRVEVEEELRKRRSKLKNQEKRLVKREENLDRKDDYIEKRENSLDRQDKLLNSKQQQLNEQQNQLDTLIKERQKELDVVSGLTTQEAQELVMKETKESMTKERALIIKTELETAKERIKADSNLLVVQAIQKHAADIATETISTVVSFEDDNLKGRVIGREGRNIRSFESITGVDMVIDDTPGVIVLSSFDPIRREKARLTLEKLLKDGRINPSIIEDTLAQVEENFAETIKKNGEQVVFDLEISSIHADLIPLIGMMKYYFSYGQNLLDHAIEVANISGLLASELDEDLYLAKEAGLLHDIGKVIKHQKNETHAQLGVEFVKQYDDNAILLDTIANHSEPNEPQYVISNLVSAANKISISRPGAQNKDLQSYIYRLTRLEKITDNFNGVQKSYAVKTGNEIRVMVKPDVISDDELVLLIHDLKSKLVKQMNYVGEIKIKVIKETRSVEIAK